MNVVSSATPSDVTVPSGNAGASTVPNHLPEALHPDKVVKLSVATHEGDLNRRSALSATASLLHGVRDTTSGFVPLKSVAGTLCLILENCEVWTSFHTFSMQCL